MGGIPSPFLFLPTQLCAVFQQHSMPQRGNYCRSRAGLFSTSFSKYSYIVLEECCCSGEGTKQVPYMDSLPREGLWGFPLHSREQRGHPSKHQHNTVVRFLFQSHEHFSKRSNHGKKNNVSP